MQYFLCLLKANLRSVFNLLQALYHTRTRDIGVHWIIMTKKASASQKVMSGKLQRQEEIVHSHCEGHQCAMIIVCHVSCKVVQKRMCYPVLPYLTLFPHLDIVTVSKLVSLSQAAIRVDIHSKGEVINITGPCCCPHVLLIREIRHCCC